MGFLLGAFGKLAAGRRVRSLQARMMRIQSRLRRATRDAAEMEKMISRQEKAALNSLTCQSSMAMNVAKQGLMSSIFGSGDAAALMTKVQNGTQLTSDENTTYQNLMTQFNQMSTNMSSTCQTSAAMQKQQIEDYFEQMRELQLQPLKDEEDLLQTEKDSLESQIQIANADYEACKKMEQSDAKNLAPSYTGAA